MTPNVLKMVMCNMENPLIPRPPALPLGSLASHTAPIFPLKQNTTNGISRNASVISRTSSSSQGFRLVEQSTCQSNDETGSVYSIYKQKIDAMFESDSSTSNNSVQAKIEKMFSDVAQDNGIPMNDIGVHTFSVDYLGSVPLHEKVTSLEGLQDPLRNLYFTYKKITKQENTLTSILEISSQGLKVQYQGEKGDLEQINSFPTIAVWSAVKFVIHDNPKSTYAFLPLITDPDNMDKQSLFRSLDETEKKVITNDQHSPLFAVVMRKIGVHKQLECHGFVCQTSEDAIVIAATLYKSLVAHMKEEEKKPRNRNGVTTCMSVYSSTCNKKNKNYIPVRPPRKKKSSTSSVISDNEIISISDTKPLLSSSSKPPKKSVKTRRAPRAPEPKNEDLDAILLCVEPMKPTDANAISNQLEEFHEIKPKTFTDKLNTCMSREQKQLTEEIKKMMSEGGSKCLKKVQNVRKNEETIRKKENCGDILTKVTIPRSGSFLNAGGLTRYKNKVSRNNEQSSNGSPLGFKEIFNELSVQEGLHSLDDILGVIIDPEGMSFNDLKPIYKEFLLKLSLTLTKDELYQRSKSIMRRQKKKLLRRNSSQYFRKNHHILVGGKFRRLKHIFQRSLKIKIGNKNKHVAISQNDDIPTQVDTKLPESSISTSSYDTRQFQPKEELSVNKKQSYKKKYGELKRHKKDRTSTSDESDFISLRRAKAESLSSTLINNQNRNSSSGYVSCSECSYDSDTCTCVSADKCYCSLGEKNFSKRQQYPDTNGKSDGNFYCSQDITFCECDTDSCTESNKCYCPTAENFTIIDQLRQRGFIADHHRHKKLCKKNSNTKSTKSLKYILNPTETYYEKLKTKSDKFGFRNSLPIVNGDQINIDYELLSVANKNMKDLQNMSNMANIGLYSKNYSDGGNFGICRPVSVKMYGTTRSHSSPGPKLQSAAISGGACTEALSVKKSAEIAALFADVKLSQTTDITHLATKNFDLSSIIASRNSYNRMGSQPNYKKPTKFTPKMIEGKASSHFGHHQKNPSGLYAHKNGMGSLRSGSNSARNTNKMYSAKNGLYTIQSQSDESIRSSISDERKISDSREYFELEQQFEDIENVKNVSNNIENSLGYLP